MRTVTVKKLDDINSLDNDAFVAGEPSWLMGFAWQLTREACAFYPDKYDAEKPMRRDVTRLIRNGLKYGANYGNE
ncbi:hypothetical protein FACS1894107_12710 [Planctomycetales bacterium]|nr:hypothetical protein FACS1894107_12710 [Planctomycetales bacterium]GHS98227.1 hypothetical protein FACS1894108_05990 [Planctomycetales bacterium]GHV21196.1 hypothetical protein AGMMS49959_09930 [Planctomycetales bacterium]